MLLVLAVQTPALSQSEAASPPPQTAPNPGTYTGLFYESSHVALGHSGFFTLAVTAQGHFTGSLFIGKERYTGRGQFHSARPLTTSLWRHGGKMLVVTLRPNPDTGADGLIGSVSSPLWTAALWADRATFDARTNPAPYAGRYTLVIPGADADSETPTGDGCGWFKIDAAGRATLTATLADGTVLVEKAALSNRGDWPLFSSLYQRKGSVLGWLSFTNRPADDVHGTLSWIRPPSPRDKSLSLPATTFQATGSHYLPPAGGELAPCLTNGILILSGPTPSGTSCTNAVCLRPRPPANSAEFTSAKVSLGLKLSTGAFSGTIEIPGTTTRALFKGVVLQNQNTGAGFFLHQGASGRVYLRERLEN